MDEYRPGRFFPGFSQATQEERGGDGRLCHEKNCPRCGSYGNGLPFYMTYPMPMFWEEEDTALRDLEYLISLYPKQAKHFQGKINRILDTMDYRGSLIYDEYPDRLAIQKLSDQVTERLMKEEEAEQVPSGSRMEEGSGTEANSRPAWQAAAAQGGTRESGRSERELIQILLLHEIYRRRQNRNPGGRKIFF